MEYTHYWGVDVSKDWVDIAVDIAQAAQVVRVKQNDKAIREFITWYKKEGMDILCVMESTGGYEKRIARHMREAGISVHVAHPNKVVAFAKAKGRLAKTDAIDARLLAAYGHFISPHARTGGLSDVQETLQALSARRAQLKAMHHQETCRIQQTGQEDVKTSLEAVLELIVIQLKQIEEKLLTLIQADGALKDTFERVKSERVKSMKGIGTQTALTLVVELPELGIANKKQIAALVGVAPITKQSGHKTGKGHIQYGRPAVRRALYMAALVASRYNKKMKEFYQRLVQAGKPKKVALVAVMRKMLVVLSMMIQNKTCFEA